MGIGICINIHAGAAGTGRCFPEPSTGQLLLAVLPLMSHGVAGDS